MNKEIKAIIFDFGNVIIDIDFELTFEAFSNICLKSASEVKRLFYEADIFRKYESGFYNDDEFRDVIRQLLGFPLNDGEIDKAWNALLLKAPANRVAFLQDLRIEMPIYMLSNTNKIHVDWCQKYFQRTYNIPDFKKLFRTAFFSYDLMMWKPDTEIYEYVLKEIELEAHEVLFLDDNVENIKSANEMGINTVLMEPNMCLTEVLKNYL